MKLAPPLWVLAPALVMAPVLLLLPGISHGGGWELIGQFAWAAVTPSLDPVVLQSVLQGLGITVGIALLGWATSLLLGLALGVLSSRTVWHTLAGSSWPAELLRRLLAVPRAIHELLWGLLLLALLGLQPAVAIAAIAIPYGALVARMISDLLDALPTRQLEALRGAGAGPIGALVTAIGPPLMPQVISYGGYRLECALRSATLLGVFGLGGLGAELRLTLQSLNFQELWSGLWILLAAMLALEALLARLRSRWAMPGRLGLSQRSVGRRGREMLLATGLLLPLLVWISAGLEVNPATLLHPQPLPPAPPLDLATLAAFPWPWLIVNTLVLTLTAAGLAVGGAPLLLLVAQPWWWARALVRLLWAFGRLWPPPLTALLLLFVLQPGVLTGALALAFHNLGILGRLLLEAAEAGTDSTGCTPAQQALEASGCGERLALLYGRFSGLASPYLAYGAYRTDVILRESVVVGLVGATGLGSALLEALSSFAWDQVGALVLAYSLLTLLGEDLSDRTRRRLLVNAASADALPA
ncbi:MAG: ABC transporter permease subunit [Cyanobacteriota bacterium]|jgi:phosphonate transport system permease protein|nr:ABC transporter permease subunit [Cyanobacteriota bacterium]